MRASCFAFGITVGVLVVGCGGKVTFDGRPGQGGASTTGSGAGSTTPITSDVGAGAGSSAGGSTTSGVVDAAVTAVSSSTGAGGSDVTSLCTHACQLAQAEGCGQDDCEKSCEEQAISQPQCESLYLALLQCMVDSTSGANLCQDPSMTACGPALSAWESCSQVVTPGCQTSGCAEDSQGGCECDGTCNAHKVQAQCSATDCHCLIDGDFAGECTPGPAACDLDSGCCGPIFQSVN
jgi:hypothetical protein